MIRLICRLLITGNEGEKDLAIKCLAKISEIESQSILETLKEESAVCDLIYSSVSKLLHSLDNQSNLTAIDSINFYLVVLINITREEISDQFVKSLLFSDQNNGDNLLEEFQLILSGVGKISSSGNNHLAELIVRLLLNLSRSSLIQNEIQTSKDNLASLLKVILNLFENSTNPKLRTFCLLIIVNFLISGSAQETMLDSKLELIVKILSPLAGPTSSELDDEDMAQLPLDLQYLPPETEREADNCVRDALISCLLLCCNTKNGRESLKSNGTYYILREYHKWEKNRPLQKRIEDVVDILIKDEEEFDKFPDLISTQIPEHLLGKFDEMDRDLLTE